MLEMVDEQNNQYYSQNNTPNQQQPGYGSVDGVSGGAQPQSSAGGYYAGSQQQPANNGYAGGDQSLPQPIPQYQQQTQPQAQAQQNPQNFSQQAGSNYQNQGFTNNPGSAQGASAPQQSQTPFQPTQGQSLPTTDYTNMFGIEGANQTPSGQPNIWQPKTDSNANASAAAANQSQYLNSSYPGSPTSGPGYAASNSQAGLNQPNPYQRDEIQPHRPVKHKPKSGKHGMNSFISTLLILLIAPLLAFMLMQFVFQTYEVDGPSMENTLSTQDRLIVWKAPRTLAKIRGNDYVPERGDILVFYSNDHGGSWSSERRQLIKRVVGLPGERVVVKNGQITVYNTEYPDGFNPDLEDAEDKDILPATPTDNIDIDIPDDSLYFVGDNRNNSLDSRTFGPVPLENIVGRLVFRMMPVAEARGF
jgi:signal peptidase I